MDHAQVAAGRVVLSDQAPDPALHFFSGVPFADAGIPDEEEAPGRTLLGAFALTAAAAAVARVPAWSATLGTPGPALQGPVDDHDVLQLTRDIEGRSTTRRQSREITVYGGEVRQASDRFDLLVSMEPTPTPDSRITLTDELDALGMPRADLQWAIASDDWHSMERGIEVLARELGRAGVARVYRAEAEGITPVLYGSHHMGTTRMHTDPALGVVDANCEVHGVSGLYVGGSSVFPSVGFSNPTLTIVALALRMAERLQRVLAT
jgi:choline dehydrogenase-like flavoprotein